MSVNNLTKGWAPEASCNFDCVLDTFKEGNGYALGRIEIRSEGGSIGRVKGRGG